MKGTRYRDLMVSRENVTWMVEILQEGWTGQVTGLEFPAGEPLMIEWQKREKEDVIIGSSATLRIISPGDRTFTDLYTIEPGAIVLKVYREGVLYWTGALDPEFYEEPYELDRDYEVTLTFSDFGILDRLNYDLEGIVTAGKIVERGLELAGLGELPTEVSALVSTTFDRVRKVTVETLKIRSDNFVDEEGEASSYKEVIEGLLQPLGQKMIQRGGRIWIYDLNGLYESGIRRLTEWNGDSQTMGTDKVANEVKVTFSPYDDPAVIDGSLDEKEILTTATAGGTWMKDNDWDDTADGFKLYYGAQEDLPLTVTNGAGFFRIDSQYSGNDEAGVIWAMKGFMEENYNRMLLNPTFPAVMLNGVIGDVKPIITTRRGMIGDASYARSRYRLKVTLDVLFDPRYNPFESAEQYNEEGNYGKWQDWVNFAYVPIMLNLVDSEGNVTWHYENNTVMESDGFKGDGAGWKEGAGEWGCAWLCYYDEQNRKSASGLTGWSTNRQIIGYYRKDLPKKWRARGTGEFIELPPEGGWLELQIGRGIHQFDYNRKSDNDVYRIARWLLYKDPKVEVVNANGTALKSDDVEYSGYINKLAKDGIDISTICGTTEGISPTARGAYMRADNGDQIQKLWRAEVNDNPERLLIGTLYSQYATRKTVLSGLARLDSGGLAVYEEKNQPGKVFMMLGETQDIAADESKITIAELAGDDYESIEEVK